MTKEEADAIQNASTEGKTEAEKAQITKMKNILWGQSYESGTPTDEYLYWWLGAASWIDDVWLVYGRTSNLNRSDFNNDGYGVRPVIIFSKS